MSVQIMIINYNVYTCQQENTTLWRIQMNELHGFVPKFLLLYYIMSSRAAASILACLVVGPCKHIHINRCILAHWESSHSPFTHRIANYVDFYPIKKLSKTQFVSLFIYIHIYIIGRNLLIVNCQIYKSQMFLKRLVFMFR